MIKIINALIDVTLIIGRFPEIISRRWGHIIKKRRMSTLALLVEISAVTQQNRQGALNEMTRGDDPTGRATRFLEEKLHSHAVEDKMSDCCAARPTYGIYKIVRMDRVTGPFIVGHVSVSLKRASRQTNNAYFAH